MASEAVQTHLCGNCKRDIPLINFTIHEVHCRRNIRVCKVCKEPFPTSDMEEHMINEHAPVTCKCKMTMEKSLLEEHERTACPLRLAKCKFCELELAFDKLGNHEDYCGARTERCEKCGCSVMTKDLSDHPAVCGKVPEQKKPTRVDSWTEPHYEGAWFDPLDDGSAFTESLFSHLPQQLPSRFYGKSILSHAPKSSNADVAQNRKREQNRGSEQTNKHRFRDFPVEIKNDIPEEIHGPRTYEPVQFHSDLNRAPLNPDLDPPFRARHKDFWTDFYANDKKKHNYGQHNFSHVSDDEGPRSNSINTPTNDDIQLPCEFCEELFPEQELILHQSACGPYTNSSSRNRKQPNALLDFTQHSNSSTPHVPNSQSVLIPCEFCGILMEGDILFHHQDQCDMAPNTGRSSPDSQPLFPGDIAHEEESIARNISAAAQHHATRNNHDVSSKNQRRPNTEKPSYPARVSVTKMNNSSLHRPSLEEIRKRNMEENSRLYRSQRNDIGSSAPYEGASNRDIGPRNKPAKKVNKGIEDVDKEE